MGRCACVSRPFGPLTAVDIAAAQVAGPHTAVTDWETAHYLKAKKTIVPGVARPPHIGVRGMVTSDDFAQVRSYSLRPIIYRLPLLPPHPIARLGLRPRAPATTPHHSTQPDARLRERPFTPPAIIHTAPLDAGSRAARQGLCAAGGGAPLRLPRRAAHYPRRRLCARIAGGPRSHAHATCTCQMHVPHARTACTCHMHVPHARAARYSAHRPHATRH